MLNNNIQTLAELGESQIAAINSFLSNHNYAPFSGKQVDFLQNIDELDVLDLLCGCTLVRGYFADFRNSDKLGENFEGLSAQQLIEQYVSDLRATDGIDEVEISQLKLEKIKQAEAEVSAHGIILCTNKYPESEILMLNSFFQPLYIEHVSFS